MVIHLINGQREIAKMLASKNTNVYALAQTSNGQNIIVCHAGKNGAFGNADVYQYIAQGFKVVSCYPASVTNALDGMNWNTRTSFSIFGNRLTVSAE